MVTRCRRTVNANVKCKHKAKQPNKFLKIKDFMKDFILNPNKVTTFIKNIFLIECLFKSLFNNHLEFPIHSCPKHVVIGKKFPSQSNDKFVN